MPTAEIEVAADVVAALVQAQHPDLAAPLRRVANGWDNVIFRLGEDLAVRLPRRAVAVTLIENEQRWLSVLAPQTARGGPGPGADRCPERGVPMALVDHAVVRRPPSDPSASRRAPAVRGGARPLPRPPAHPGSAGCSRNPVRGVPLAGRSEVLLRQLETSALPEPDVLRRHWDRLVATPAWSGPPLWLHGDPHPGNVLVRAGTVSAVIDFGDLTAGDPATDLALAWLAFDRAARDLLRAAYADERALDDDTWTRARGWALCLGVALIANSDDEPVLAAVGRHALGEVLADAR